MIQVYLSDTETQLALAKSCHNEKDYATAHFHMKMATVAFAKVMAYLFRPSLHANISAENLYPAVRHLMGYYKDAINIVVTAQAGNYERCIKLEKQLDRGKPPGRDQACEYNLSNVRFFEKSVQELPVEIPCENIVGFLNESALPFSIYLKRNDRLLCTNLDKQLDKLDADPGDESRRELRSTVVEIAAEVASVFSALYTCAVISLNDGDLIGKKKIGLYRPHPLSIFESPYSYPSGSAQVQYNFLTHLSDACSLLSRLAGVDN